MLYTRLLNAGVFSASVRANGYLDESVRRLTGGKDRVESPADWPVEGLLAHLTGEGESGFRVVDVWDSEESFGRFGETHSFVSA